MRCAYAHILRFSDEHARIVPFGAVGERRSRHPESAMSCSCYAATLRSASVAAELAILLFGMTQQPQGKGDDDRAQEHLRLRNKFPPKSDHVDRPINEADRQTIVQSKPGILRRLLQHLKHDADKR